jgi:hypothetical protein
VGLLVGASPDVDSNDYPHQKSLNTWPADIFLSSSWTLCANRTFSAGTKKGQPRNGG